MSAGWIAGDVRARELASEPLDVAASVAAATNLGAGIALLGQAKWIRDVAATTTVVASQRAVLETLLWRLRVIAGWLPSEGVEMVRSCVAWFEIRNIEDRLAYFVGAPASVQYELGRLGIISRPLGATSNGEDIRQLMAASAWGDPGSADAYRIRIWLRRMWHKRARDASPQLRVWSDAAAWLLAARERTAARSGADLLARTPPLVPSPWKWASVDWAGSDLWRAEERWWTQVREEGLRLLHTPIGTPGPALGAITTLASSAHRIATALEIAAGVGGGDIDAAG